MRLRSISWWNCQAMDAVATTEPWSSMMLPVWMKLYTIGIIISLRKADRKNDDVFWKNIFQVLKMKIKMLININYYHNNDDEDDLAMLLTTLSGRSWWCWWSVDIRAAPRYIVNTNLHWLNIGFLEIMHGHYLWAG